MAVTPPYVSLRSSMPQLRPIRLVSLSGVNTRD